MGVLGVAALAWAPILMFTKKMYENSELMKGATKAINMAIGAVGDTILYFMYFIYKKFFAPYLDMTDRQDTAGNNPMTAQGATSPWITSWEKWKTDWEDFWDKPSLTKAWESVKSVWNDVIRPDWKYIFDPERVMSALPSINISDMFKDVTGTITSFSLSDYIKLPNIKLSDLFSKGMQTGVSSLNLKDFITLPDFKLTDIFSAKDFDINTLFDPLKKIKVMNYLPKIKFSELFDLTEEGTNDLVRMFERWTGLDLPGGD
jgi:hypothetical protein